MHPHPQIALPQPVQPIFRERPAHSVNSVSMQTRWTSDAVWVGQNHPILALLSAMGPLIYLGHPPRLWFCHTSLAQRFRATNIVAASNG